MSSCFCCCTRCCRCWSFCLCWFGWFCSRWACCCWFCSFCFCCWAWPCSPGVGAQRGPVVPSLSVPAAAAAERASPASCFLGGLGLLFLLGLVLCVLLVLLSVGRSGGAHDTEQDGRTDDCDSFHERVLPRQPRRGRGDWLSPFALRRLALGADRVARRSVRRPVRSCTVTVRMPAEAVERPVEVAREGRTVKAPRVGDAHLRSRRRRARGRDARVWSAPRLDHDGKTPGAAKSGPVHSEPRSATTPFPVPRQYSRDGRARPCNRPRPPPACRATRSDRLGERGQPGRTCIRALQSQTARADRDAAVGVVVLREVVVLRISGRRSGRSRRGARRSSGAAAGRAALLVHEEPRRCSKSAWATAGAWRSGCEGGKSRGSGRGSREAGWRIGKAAPGRRRRRRLRRAAGRERKEAASRRCAHNHARYDVSVLLDNSEQPPRGRGRNDGSYPRGGER